MKESTITHESTNIGGSQPTETTCAWGQCCSVTWSTPQLKGGVKFVPFLEPRVSVQKRNPRQIKTGTRPFERQTVNIVGGNCLHLLARTGVNIKENARDLKHEGSKSVRYYCGPCQCFSIKLYCRISAPSVNDKYLYPMYTDDSQRPRLVHVTRNRMKTINWQASFLQSSGAV